MRSINNIFLPIYDFLDNKPLLAVSNESKCTSYFKSTYKERLTEGFTREGINNAWERWPGALHNLSMLGQRDCKYTLRMK